MARGEPYSRLHSFSFCYYNASVLVREARHRGKPETMTERTEFQSRKQLERSRELSLQGTRAPAEIPGYQMQRFLGSGAYGEVWVAVDRNTQRRVAIKFYTHRGGLDWTLLSREVEKLAFLSADRYVVQLLDVGWDATPPFYVMEYVEQGSLEDHLAREGPLPVAEAVEMFREVAVGLMHAHGRGVLHCDLKPANVLLDQDAKPRLADFGQSRLSHEQTPALGTLFYMAPEQADMEAMPDAKWDVYALGALLYTMLTGSPPYRDEAVLAELDAASSLEDRLAIYRRAIRQAPPPTAHRDVPGVDKALADIVDRCIDADPQRRCPNVQSVLDELQVREVRRQRWPLVVLGTIGPAVLVLVVAFLAWRLIDTSIRHFEAQQTISRLNETRGTALRAADWAGFQMDQRFAAVERLAKDEEFRRLLAEIVADPEFQAIAARLNDPNADDPQRADEMAALRKQLLEHPLQKKLQARLVKERNSEGPRESASWFVDGPGGLQVARDPLSATLGRNYAWRTYFTGEPDDRPRTWRPPPSVHLTTTHISAPFLSQATGHWVVTISTPVFGLDKPARFLGIVALTVELGAFDELRGTGDGAERFDHLVLVDRRPGEKQWLILQHPLLDKLRRDGEIPERLSEIRLTAAGVPDDDKTRRNYRDPLAQDVAGGEYNRRWLADAVPVLVQGAGSREAEDTGLLVIVQQPYDLAIGNALIDLRRSLTTISLLALVVITAVLMLLWGYVVRRFNRTAAARAARTGSGNSLVPTESMVTLPDVEQMRKQKQT